MEEQEEFITPKSNYSTQLDKYLEDSHKKEASKSPFMNHWAQLGLLLMLLGAGLVFGSFAAIGIVKLMVPHIHLLSLETEITKPSFANAAKVIQLITTVFMFFLPAYVFSTIVYKKPFMHLGFNNKVNINQVAIVVLIAIMALFVGALLGDLNEMIPLPKHWQEVFKKAEDAYNDQVLSMAKMSNFKEYIMAIFIIALIPAIVEESFFRGTMQQLFINWFRNPWAGIIVTSIIFSAIHISYYGFLTRASLGVILGLIFYYSKNIWLNIFAHFLNNAFAVTALYIYSMNGKPTKDALEDHFPWWICIASTFVMIALMAWFKKQSEQVVESKSIIQS